MCFFEKQNGQAGLAVNVLCRCDVYYYSEAVNLIVF